MGISLFFVGLIFFMLFIVIGDVNFMYVIAACWGIAVVLQVISDYIHQDVSISTEHIPITNTDDFFITSDITNRYVCFDDGCGKHYVIPKEKVLIETLSDDEANSICIEFIEITITKSIAKSVLSNLVSAKKSTEYYYFVIPESANKLQTTTEPRE